ncbi:CDP-glycerol glycerophosphotransferase family protein [Microbacterium sp.]|uniref:CDP-glycerol glycerophosphotransferase family protein n=1 Tax=Microbacterium sp. TaxID=51671 RepID=UPI00092B9C2F|nr:CDP-glycerol glycerophosphotransferase family protein [Microbacterium sp.]MBN9192805.1 CDP-glycerol glycerophosphotransferase family protein [Microbacterium sp.]OJU70786.1 MAG: hypothetical protein BGO04_10055 [Microbacterium sp. 70-38]
MDHSPSSRTPADAADPLISLVVPMFGVGAYLPSFLRSLDDQGDAIERVEIIFVNDGSPDDSRDLAAAWVARSGARARVVSQPNAGLSAARNTGMSIARGEWVSFPDPDDMLATGYLTAVLDAVDSAGAQDIPVVATNIVYFYEASSRFEDSHPLRGAFADGRRIVDLEREPQSIKLQAATTFFRLAEIRRHDLRFDPRVRPNFEDGAFHIGYLSRFERPMMAVVPDAVYHYRRRADESSLVATSWLKPEKYIEIPRFGWLEALRGVRERTGRVPAWAQFIVFYDMQWYFQYDSRIHTPTKGQDAAVKGEFMRIVREVLELIDAETVVGYRITGLSRLIRLALVCLKGEDPPLSPVAVWRLDRSRNAVQLRYVFRGDPPVEEFRADGGTLEPIAAKTRDVQYFGETIAHERIVWLSADRPLAVWLNGTRSEISYGVPATPNWLVSDSGAWTNIARRDAPRTAATDLGDERGAPAEPLVARARRQLDAQTSLRREQWGRIVHGRSVKALRPIDRVTARVSRSRRISDRFGDAWVFIDRDVQAQDNAEHLYRWVRTHRPDVNAWFVLNRDSVDWDRLAVEGFRLVAHGSTAHTLLMLNARHLISSHIDHYIVSPYDRRRFPAGGWQFTFLQHGVTINDISRWINSKPIALMITATADEQRWLAGDGSPFALTERETVLTGFPRHDALLDKAARLADAERDAIVIMPTWREYLMGPPSGTGNRRELVDGFFDSDYVRSWFSLVGDPRLAAAAAAAERRIVFVPHPNLEGHIRATDVPSGVELRGYADGDIQDVIARACVLVTDYSSLAFEAGILETPVVYYQFDEDDFFASHPHRPGYFDARRDGFGPVVVDHDGAVGAIETMLDRDAYRASDAALRARDTFAFRDGLSSLRVFEAIDALSPAPANDPGRASS